LPKVILSGSAGRQYTGGQSEIEVKADNFRRLILELDQRFPGLGNQIEESMAVAVDGIIYQDCYDVALREGSEIVLIPKIAGG
jgi:molybdopterin converting factor small subunit